MSSRGRVKRLLYFWSDFDRPQQRIVTTGPRGWDGKYDFSVVRFTPDGAYDATFGNIGKVHTQFFLNGVRESSRPYDVALGPDGKIVAAGAGTDLDAIMARYQP
ncbi:MAG: hypothetical protein DMF63_09765 [Acidobacteria bacterium]|nr:MAG: hypothetical protein DMF63_09765 [Acidobacteriota bacterium]